MDFVFSFVCVWKIRESSTYNKSRGQIDEHTQTSRQKAKLKTQYYVDQRFVRTLTTVEFPYNDAARMEHVS